ncbi:MAG: methyltransferase domain-containing protein [Bacteroidota bacterium]
MIHTNQSSTNMNMRVNGVLELSLNNGDRVLELEHGNCSHLRMLMSHAQGIEYNGLEISPLLTDEAKRINTKLLSKYSVQFKGYEGYKIPFPDYRFDKTFTVNSLSLLKNPIRFMDEMFRVLCYGGKSVVVVSQTSALFDEISSLAKLVGKTPFKLLHLKTKKELLQDKFGDFVERKYQIAVLGKAR